MKQPRSVYTEAALRIAGDIAEFQRRLRANIPASFMREKMTPRQFKQEYGIGVREWDALRAKHGDETARQVIDMLRAAGVPPQGGAPVLTEGVNNA